VGTGVDLTIADLAHLVAGASGFAGSIDWDSSRPDGTERKLLDVTRLGTLGWQARIGLQEGLKQTVAAYQAQPPQPEAQRSLVP
jgi:GDP-L-fucose synthase